MSSRRSTWPRECPVFEYGNGARKYIIEAEGLNLSRDGLRGIFGRYVDTDMNNSRGLWTLRTIDEFGFRPLTWASRELLKAVRK